MRHDLSDQAPAQKTWPDFDMAAELLERMSGFPKYPDTEKGREVFIEALMRCDSEEQGRRVIDAFEETFPLLKELRDAVHSTRSRDADAGFESQKAKWIAEGYTFDPDWAGSVAAEFERKRADKKRREAAEKISHSAKMEEFTEASD